MGRYVRKDPIIVIQSSIRELIQPVIKIYFDKNFAILIQNFYYYANDNPITFIDPWGLTGYQDTVTSHFEDCAKKFADCAKNLEAKRIERIIQLVGRLEQLEDIREIIGLLT